MSKSDDAAVLVVLGIILWLWRKESTDVVVTTPGGGTVQNDPNCDVTTGQCYDPVTGEPIDTGGGGSSNWPWDDPVWLQTHDPYNLDMDLP